VFDCAEGARGRRLGELLGASLGDESQRPGVFEIEILQLVSLESRRGQRRTGDVAFSSTSPTAEPRLSTPTVGEGGDQSSSSEFHTSLPEGSGVSPLESPPKSSIHPSFPSSTEQSSTASERRRLWRGRGVARGPEPSECLFGTGLPRLMTFLAEEEESLGAKRMRRGMGV